MLELRSERESKVAIKSKATMELRYQLVWMWDVVILQ